MSYEHIDIEKDPMLSTTSELSPTSSRLSPLRKYQLLVGDINAPISSHNDSLWAEILYEERKARTAYFFSGTAFFFCVAAQIILCLGIAIGAQLMLTKTEISALAGVNTAVAATIGVLKGLGLPEKKGLERYRLGKLKERIKVTTRKLRAGLDVDADAEAEETRRLYDEAEDGSQIAVADMGATVAGALPAPKK